MSDYPDGSFDYVLLSHTLQELRNPDVVLREALRVGKRVIVVFPNFAYYRARLHIFFTGRVPVTPSLPYQWHDTPNLHFLSIADFTDYCDRKNLKIEKTFFVRKNRFISIAPNLFGQLGVFVISPDTETKPKSEDQIPWYIF